MFFHPLTSTFLKPKRLNCPFCYEPHPIVRLAAKQVQAVLPEMEEGKMFGVLVAENEKGELGFLAAYSGQADMLEANSTMPDDYFVPAVFDYLQPEGYFKIHEAEITAINHRISALETSEDYLANKETLQTKSCEYTVEVERMRREMAVAKKRRDALRQNGQITQEETKTLIRESQFQKAELHRKKKSFQAQLAQIQQAIELQEDLLLKLKEERKQRSDSLQRWLFDTFRIADSHGEQRSLADIFADANRRLPPSGAGECCEPKLLHYAFTHGLRPLSIGMFWWGKSPTGEVRKSGHFYPACQSKCHPLLSWMLRDFPVDVNPLESFSLKSLEMIYEDEVMAVVCKPEGLLSVPGRCNAPSVYSVLRKAWADTDSPIIVHRLDMDTSGLMVVAKTRDAHRCLQQQFEHRKIRKVYVALLENPMEATTGTIDLPLRRNPDDSPRQMVDRQCGKPSLTLYNIIDVTNGHARIELHPQTGRTHQLRMHCAHREGLDNPILGDRLYGHLDTRLYLHAMRLTLRHPTTGKLMTFERQPDF